MIAQYDTWSEDLLKKKKTKKKTEYSLFVESININKVRELLSSMINGQSVA